MVRRILAIPPLRLTLYLTLLAVIVGVLFAIAEDFSTGHLLNQASIEAFIENTGPYSYIVYTATVAFLALTPVASSTLWLIAGYLFNPLIAIVLTVLAELIGAIGNFFIGKQFIGRILMNGRWPRLSETVSYYTTKIDSLLIFTLALIPVSTTNVTAYAASLSGMSLWRFLAAWVGGVTILATVTIYLGHSASARSPFLTGAMVVAAAALLLIARYVVKRYANTPTIDQVGKAE